MTKAELRKTFSQKRKALSESDYEQLNSKLCRNFFSFVDLSSVHVLHIFLPIEKNKEPNTWLIIERLHKEFPHIRLSLPRVKPGTNELENFYFEGAHHLQKSKWGILEPVQGTLTMPDEIDMVLVPFLAFDRHGHRVGYGKGFYDRFLKTCRPDCYKVGLSLFNPVEEIDDLDEHDMSLQACLTPEGFITF